MESKHPSGILEASKSQCGSRLIATGLYSPSGRVKRRIRLYTSRLVFFGAKLLVVAGMLAANISAMGNTEFFQPNGNFSTPLSVVAKTNENSLYNDFQYLSRRLFGFDSLPGISVFDAIGAADAVRKNQRIADLCDKIDARYRSLGWGRSPCSNLPWTYDRVSESGYPLIYWDYSALTWGSGEPAPDESTLVLGGVHPDELTPINLAFRFANALRNDNGLFAQHRVVVAPLVNPDGFFMFPARRTNANGVDLNRNFATRDWWNSALRWWKQRRNADPRHFPGQAPDTEEGTRFQVDLMGRYKPDKVVSIHAPLGFLDYDGPGDSKRKNLSDNEKKARDLAYVVSRNSNNYRVLDFEFYPGSLGNFAGNERQVPTVTLELTSTNPRFADKYWREFFPGLRAAVKYEFKRSVLARMDSLSLQTSNQNICCQD
jgi:protein MpaA